MYSEDSVGFKQGNKLGGSELIRGLTLQVVISIVEFFEYIKMCRALLSKDLETSNEIFAGRDQIFNEQM
jgi:hypothetical protein